LVDIKRSVLILCDDFWHPAQVPREGLGALQSDEFSFDWIEDAREWSAARMAAYPLVVLTKSNNVSAADKTGWMTEAVQAAFAEYVRQGNGLLAIHSGTAEYADKPVLRRLLGGVFDHHPEQCPVTVEPQPGHPLCAGSEPFTLQDEHYFMALDDPQAEVYVTTRSENGVQPGGWIRREAAGRVAVLTPGHNLEVWLHPAFQALLRNALRWCGKMI
jgi:type 1 glutamine amidotransferase